MPGTAHRILSQEDYCAVVRKANSFSLKDTLCVAASNDLVNGI